VLGWTGGYVLVAILMAPYLRKFGQFTVPDFFGARYGGNVARALAVVVLIYRLFHLRRGADRRRRHHHRALPRDPFELACFVGLVGILLCSMLGGMRRSPGRRWRSTSS
jgi:cation/acetate symporter